jgi:hypothetical protein
MNRIASSAAVAVLTSISLLTATAQSPQPVIIQAQPQSAANPAAVPTQPDGAAATSAAAALSMLQQIKQANDETLAKQQATLQTLDELQKAAEQIRILSKRS